MARKEYRAQIGTCSWIDPKTGLPEVDKQPPINPVVQQGFIAGKNGFRFSNFMSVRVVVDDATGLVQESGFNPLSGIYRGPSFANIPSHAFEVIKSQTKQKDHVAFSQIVGARTVSPEVIGELGGFAAGAVTGAIVGSVVPVIGTGIGAAAGALIGFASGRTVAHQAKGFPPIWTELRIRLFLNGRVESELWQHSFFPSVTTYREQLDDNLKPTGYFEKIKYLDSADFYDAKKPGEYDTWGDKGWGPRQAAFKAGACGGNPWGITKGVMGLGEDEPN